MANIANVLLFLYPSASFGQYLVTDNGGGQFISHWNSVALGLQPSQAQLDAAEIDPAFITWLATHGGNPGLTRRRLAKEALNLLQEHEVLTRAVVAVTADEVNLIRQWLADFKTQTALATSLANLQTRVAALPNMPQRTLPQIRTAIANKIDSGDVDS